jgi:hypothetical protein
MKQSLSMGVWMAVWLAFALEGVAGESGAVRVMPGVRKMEERLRAIIAAEDPMNNTFRNRERAAILEEGIRNEREPGLVWEKLPRLAEEQLNAGDPMGALESLRRFDELTAVVQQALGPRQQQMILHLSALCHLRLGEQQNCLTNHTIESCLLPIGPLGVYGRQEGPRKAIEVLSEALRRFRNDLKGVWLLNLAYMTLGEYPDKVPPQWLIPPRVFESDYDLKRFTDVASGADLDLHGWAGGCVLEDFDNDGFLDLMLSSWEIRTQLRYFRNNGDGSFTERTREAGLTGEIGGLNMIQADYNNDGYTDVLLLRGAWLGAVGQYPSSLLRNNGDGTFENVTEEAGMLGFHPTQTAVWFDYNGDGWLDLFIGTESYGSNSFPCRLYRNNHDGTFTECAAPSGVAALAYVKGVGSADFNNDGRPDLYLSSRSGANLLLRNDGPQGADKGPKAPWKFTDIATSAGVIQPMMSFPTACFDYDNDGWADILVTGYALQSVGDIVADYMGKPFRSETARFYRNNRDGTFTDATKEVKLNKLILAMALNFGDFDNDGWLDFYTGTGDPDLATLIPNRAFRNAEGKFFQDVTTSAGVGNLQKGHAISFGDIDNDGDQDIYTVIGGAYTDDTYRCSLFENPGHGNRWITLKLEGVKSNRSARGARIKVTVKTAAGERVIYKTVGSGASFGASPLRQEIGLGQAQAIQSVEIFWPATGQTQVLKDLALDRFYKVREGDATAAPWNVRKFKLRPPDEQLCAPPGTSAPAKPNSTLPSRPSGGG